MSTARPFAFNTGSTISSTEQLGDIAIGVLPENYALNYGGVKWWNGPDEDLGYIICYPNSDQNHPSPDGNVAGVGFFRSVLKTDESFISLVNDVFDQNFVTGLQAKTYLNNNGYWTSWPGQLPQGMVLFLDAGDSLSYSGSGSVWYDLSGLGNNGFLSGATYSSDNGGTMVFDGVNDAITFSNPSEIPIGNEPYTISVWFNSDEMPSIRGFIGWGAFGNVNQVNAWRLQTFAGGATGFVHYWWGNDLSFQTSLSSGVWYNAVAAYSNGSRKIYLNNVKVAEDNPTGHNVPYSDNLRVGVTYDGFNEWFDGKIAQVIIYKRQATESEIEAIWNSGKYRFGYGATPTPTPTNTLTSTPTPTSSNTPTVSLSQTTTPTNTPTTTSTNTPTITLSNTTTRTPTPTPTPTSTTPSTLAVHFDISNSSSYPGSGNQITDLSGNGNTGTLNGDYTYSALNSGTISMGGTNSYVNIPQSASINISNTSTPVSVVMWINITAGYSNGDGIWNKNFDAPSYDGFRLIAQSNNQVRLGINGGSYDYNFSSANNSIATGTWMMLTTIVQEGTSYVYRDNNSTPIVSGLSTAQSLPSNTANLQLCVGEFNTLGNYLPCRWGQFRYYKNKSLSTAEISALFDADKAKYGL